ncbi:gamma carbonic anhydrase family protein [Loktanella sp. SALINAS62]|uniref:gamma carbonic anhydrase family protein n=1 Tax=Loktanella sp. SALINAS62 TaxID=2706124 RepID=UPI001B8D79EC|nr:gamma carbonic anhydrase family protein [Loktanella sp. SALINAS62]MBS1302866.1 gamma carbonic anhydrase family protein [Loktanella sp. SALINAS62]
MTLYTLADTTPDLGPDVWIAPGAHVMGGVTLGARVNIWFGAVIRGDNDPIIIGADTNIQENSVLHTDVGFPLTIGTGCTIGHKAMLHGCTLGDNTLIGMGATVLNGAVIGKNCLIGAGALITEGKTIPDGSLVMGAPGKVVRQLDEAAIAGLRLSAQHYVQNAARFSKDLKELK